MKLVAVVAALGCGLADPASAGQLWTGTIVARPDVEYQLVSLDKAAVIGVRLVPVLTGTGPAPDQAVKPCKSVDIKVDGMAKPVVSQHAYITTTKSVALIPRNATKGVCGVKYEVIYEGEQK